MTYPEDFWTDELVEIYRNTALVKQPDVPDGVAEISQDPELFSIFQPSDVDPGTGFARTAAPGAPYTSTAQAMISQARLYLGMRENPANTNDITREYNLRYDIGTNSFAWCDASITLEALHSDNEAPVLGGHGKSFAYVPAHAAWFSKIGRLHWGKATKPGQVQFFRWAGAAHTTMCDHVGLVESVNDDGTITCLEGNSADVFRRVKRDGRYTACYGDPDYLPPDPDQWPGRYLQLKSPMMHGGDVTWVQLHLNTKGWKLDADGRFGKMTKSAVVAFQKSAKLDADGVVGPATWKALV